MDADQPTDMPVLTADEYWNMVKEGAALLAEEFEEEVREHVRGESRDSTVKQIRMEAENIVQFQLDHPHMLGFNNGASYAYLGSILEHSDYSGHSGYYNFVRKPRGPNRSDGPVNPAEALAWGALFAMQKDVRDAAQTHWKQLKNDERELLADGADDSSI